MNNRNGCLQVDLVEVSPANRKKQWETLRCRPSGAPTLSAASAGSGQPSAEPPTASAASQGTVGDDGTVAGVSDITGAQASGERLDTLSEDAEACL